MNLASITICELPEQTESLALSLLAVAAAEGASLDYDDLCAGLGISFAAVSTTAEPLPGWWLTYGRDAFIEPAARMFGFRLRDLHPPDVGVDMLAAEEYPQHWAVSYTPLVQSALMNNQPVLAWQGWEDGFAPLWGVITTYAGDQFQGTVAGAAAQRVRLIAPAVQCYVIEEFDRQVIVNRYELFRLAMRHADAYMNRAILAAVEGMPAGPPHIVTGPAAFDAWEQWLAADEFDELAWNEHRHHAAGICAGRRSAMRFLRASLDFVSKERVPLVFEAIGRCETLVNRLAESCDEAACRERFLTRAGRETLLQSVHEAEAQDRQLARHVAELASC